MNKLSEALSRKIGPFPLGVWLLIVGAGISLAVLIRRMGEAKQDKEESTQAQDEAFTDPTAGAEQVDLPGTAPFGVITGSAPTTISVPTFNVVEDVIDIHVPRFNPDRRRRPDDRFPPNSGGETPEDRRRRERRQRPTRSDRPTDQDATPRGQPGPPPGPSDDETPGGDLEIVGMKVPGPSTIDWGPAPVGPIDQAGNPVPPFAGQDTLMVAPLLPIGSGGSGGSGGALIPLPEPPPALTKTPAVDGELLIDQTEAVTQNADAA